MATQGGAVCPIFERKHGDQLSFVGAWFEFPGNIDILPADLLFGELRHVGQIAARYFANEPYRRVPNDGEINFGSGVSFIGGAFLMGEGVPAPNEDLQAGSHVDYVLKDNNGVSILLRAIRPGAATPTTERSDDFGELRQILDDAARENPKLQEVFDTRQLAPARGSEFRKMGRLAGQELARSIDSSLVARFLRWVRRPRVLYIIVYSGSPNPFGEVNTLGELKDAVTPIRRAQHYVPLIKAASDAFPDESFAHAQLLGCFQMEPATQHQLVKMADLRFRLEQIVAGNMEFGAPNLHDEERFEHVVKLREQPLGADVLLICRKR